MTTGQQEAETQLQLLAATGAARFNQVDALYVRGALDGARAELDDLRAERDRYHAAAVRREEEIARVIAERDQLDQRVARVTALLDQARRDPDPEFARAAAAGAVEILRGDAGGSDR